MDEPVAQPAGGSGRAAGWSGPVAVAGAALACVAVAIAAAGEPLRGSSGPTARLHITPWLLAAPVAALLVIGFVALASFRHVGELKVGRHRPAWLRLIALLAAVLAGLVLMRPNQEHTTTEQPEFDIAPPQPAVGERHTAWPVWLGVATGAVLAAVAAAAAHRRRAPTAPPEPTEPAEVARQALTESAADLSLTAEPRQAVIAAYARLLEGLRDAGAGRKPSEAPFEHVTRVLSDLGVRADPLHRLTALFAEARFSTHEITEAHRAAALDALDDARADLAKAPACA